MLYWWKPTIIKWTWSSPKKVTKLAVHNETEVKNERQQKANFCMKWNKNWLPTYFDATRKTCIAITTNGVEIEKL